MAAGALNAERSWTAPVTEIVPVSRGPDGLGFGVGTVAVGEPELGDGAGAETQLVQMSATAAVSPHAALWRFIRDHISRSLRIWTTFPPAPT